MDNTVTDCTFIEEMVQEVEDELNHPVNADKVCVVVEGDDDISLYGKFMNGALMFFYATGDCLYVPPVLRGLPSLSDRLIGIKDADYDHLRGISYTDPNLFLTDSHDCETMMLQREEVVSNFIYEYTHQRMNGIIANVFTALEWYSYLQYYNTDVITSVNADGIRFKGLSMTKLYDGINAIDCTICLSIVRSHGNNASLPHYPTEADLRDFRSRKATADAFNLHRGHDVMHCMAIVIRQNTYPGGKSIGNDDVARDLRISYQFEDFQTTRLYQQLNAWMTLTGHHLWN